MILYTVIGLSFILYLTWIIYNDIIKMNCINELISEFELSNKYRDLIKSKYPEKISRFYFRKILRKELENKNKAS